MCIIWIYDWWELQFIVDSEGQIFEKLFMVILFTLRDFARSVCDNFIHEWDLQFIVNSEG